MTVTTQSNLFTEGALHEAFHPAWTGIDDAHDLFDQDERAAPFAMPLVHAHPARLDDEWGAVVLQPPAADELVHRVLLIHTRSGETWPSLVKHVVRWTIDRAWVTRRTVSRDQCRGRVHLFGYEREPTRRLYHANWDALAKQGLQDTLDWVAVEAPWHF